MSLKIKCYECKQELDEPGGLLFSPPDTLSGVVHKHHLCRECWDCLPYFGPRMKQMKQTGDILAFHLEGEADRHCPHPDTQCFNCSSLRYAANMWRRFVADDPLLNWAEAKEYMELPVECRGCKGGEDNRYDRGCLICVKERQDDDQGANPEEGA